MKIYKKILLSLLLITSSITALPQNLAPTPPMGWNSWNCFQQNINEQQIRDIADAMVSSGMRDAGYEYLVLDDGWMAKERDANGDLQADPEKFPSGMKAIGDYIHSKGLKYGIYECRGYLTCQQLPGSFEHEDADMAKFAEWGVDYVKLDACFAEKNGRLTTEDLQIYKDAIAKTGRDMILSISDFGNGAWVWGGKEYGQLWRTGYDIYPWIENVYHHAESSGGDSRIHPAFNGLWQFAGPDSWNDPDMLQIGNLKSEAEDRIHMSLWCMLASPLMAGNDLRTMSDTVTQVLIAPEVIAINQDPRGHQAYKVFDNGKQQVYNKPLSDGTTAVLLFNKGDEPANISVSWEQIGLTGKQKVRDLWARKNIGTYTEGFTAWQVPTHGQFLLKIGKSGSDLVKGPEPVPVEKYTAKANGFSYLSDLYYMMKYGQAPFYDQTPDEEIIRLDGIGYEKGISTVNGAIMLYKLSGNSNRFRAMVGLDDSYSGTGTGRFKVLNEDAFGGRVLFDSGLMTKDSAAIQIDIDVKGLDCLFLKFDGKENAVGSWGHARLVGSWDAHKVAYEDSYIDSLINRMEFIPIRENGDKNNRINIVIVNRWEKKETEPYNNPAMRAEFMDDVNSSMLAAFTPGDPAAQTAYANYQQFFNLYALWWPDIPEWNNGVDSELMGAIRDRMFLPWTDEHTGWVTFLLMPNRDGGGGGAARNLEDRIGSAVIAGKGIGKMLHEISHTCTSIGDEYTAAATGTGARPTYTASLEYLHDDIKWRAWVDPETPMPTPYEKKYIYKIGAFEGAQYHLTNYFRPSAQGCIMGAGIFDNTEEMCAICGQRLSMRMYTLVNPIENCQPSSGNLVIEEAREYHFSVNRVHPEPDTHETHWILNGKIIASGVDEIDIHLDPEKAYELVYSLHDKTPFIREDPPFGEFPYREKRWMINPDKEKQDAEYRFVWTESNPLHPAGLRYEAEKADIGSAEVLEYFGASEQRYARLDENSKIISWNVSADQAETYEAGFVYASAKRGKPTMELWVNGEQVDEKLLFTETVPLYTGWNIVRVDLELAKGDNVIQLRAKGGNELHLDYLWLPKNPVGVKKYREPDAFSTEVNIQIQRQKDGSVMITNPRDQYDYQWYASDYPDFQLEKAELVLHSGLSFTPPKDGNYYIGLEDRATSSISKERKGFYYSSEVAAKEKSLSPDKVKSANLLLWLDASDLNADGQTDNPAPSRDPYKDWIDKATGMKGPFIKYKPNQLNGMGVAGFEMVWVTNLEKPVTNFQTVVMVYKESDMSLPGTTPFRALDKLIDLQSEKEYEYKIMTAEFDSKVLAELRTTQGNWEGSLAEMLIYDGKLTEKELKAVESGLQKKWFSIE